VLSAWLKVPCSDDHRLQPLMRTAPPAPAGGADVGLLIMVPLYVKT
jgi:hypothetical protein